MGVPSSLTVATNDSIACLMIALWTGRKPTKRTQEMLCYFLTGWASAEEVAAHIAKLKASDEQAQKQS